MSNVVHTSYGLSVHTPIDRVVMLIARRLELDDGYDYKLERWIRLLKDNWLQTAGSLARVPDGLLEKLNLPVALKVELERIAKLPFEQQSFFHATSENTVDSRDQLKVSDKCKELVHHSFRQLLKFKDANEISGLQRYISFTLPIFICTYTLDSNQNSFLFSSSFILLVVDYSQKLRWIFKVKLLLECCIGLSKIWIVKIYLESLFS